MKTTGRGRGWRREPLVVRFFKYVDQSGGPDACHPWTGTRSTKRRGTVRGIIRADTVTGQPKHWLLAHRVALAIATGEMREDLEACHTCTNPEGLCVNSRHLYWGDHQQNMIEDPRLRRKSNGQWEWQHGQEAE